MRPQISHLLRAARPLLLPLLCLCMALPVAAQQSRIRDILEQEGVQFTNNNRLTLLTSGVEKFEDMLEAIRQARHYVHLEYFNFRNDSIGRALFNLLGEKAKQGVKVRAIFDGFGNDSNDQPLRKRHMDSIRATGVEIYEFDPIRFPFINHAYHRDHRKIVVIDGAMAYSGGMNVADYYLHGRPEFGEWRDMHFRLEGPAVTFYEYIFAQMWARVANERIDSLTGIRLRRADEFTGLKQDTSSMPKVVGVVDRVPVRTPALMRRTLSACIDNAQHHIQLVSPYFVPTRRVWKALKRAAKRGVRLEIMVSVDGDVPLTPSIVAWHVNQLRKLGAEVYYYKGGFHHSKIMMIDDEYCTIGSTNLDARSLCYDYEVNAIVLDPVTTAQLSSIFESDKAHCTLLTNENRRQIISNGKLFVGKLGNFLTWVM